MNIQKIIADIEHSAECREFFSKNKEHYLVHLFTMVDSSHKDEWQVGYYSKVSDKIVVFDYSPSGIRIQPEQEAFKEKNYIEPLDLSKVRMEGEDAMACVEKVLSEKYSAESLVRMIMLLQNLPEYGQIWNITIVTMTFSVINVKIDAASGNVIKHSKESLLGWKKE